MSHRWLPTLLAIAVAVLYGAVPLRECHAADGGGVVLAGEHAHAGSCCDGTAADAELHGCACAHHAARPDPASPPTPRPTVPTDDHEPCCVDAAASIFAAGMVVALPPPVFVGVVDAPVEPTVTAVGVRTAADGPDPGDGPPDGVVAVVLLR